MPSFRNGGCLRSIWWRSCVALLQLAQTERDTWFYAAGLGVAAFFTSALVAHRTLYEQRPAPRYLTEFYMWMSLGGVLGGVFAALIAPQIFSEVFEYPLLLALSFACRPGALSLATAKPRRSESDASRSAAMLMGGVLLIIGLPWAAAKIGTTFGVWGSTSAVAARASRGATSVALALSAAPAHGGAADVCWPSSCCRRTCIAARRSAATSASTA